MLILMEMYEDYCFEKVVAKTKWQCKALPSYSLYRNKENDTSFSYKILYTYVGKGIYETQFLRMFLYRNCVRFNKTWDISGKNTFKSDIAANKTSEVS